MLASLQEESQRKIQSEGRLCFFCEPLWAQKDNPSPVTSQVVMDLVFKAQSSQGWYKDGVSRSLDHLSSHHVLIL